MDYALQEAQKAFENNEIPVGCVIVNRHNGNIISRGYNMMQTHKNANLHAEIIAINIACKTLQTKELSDYDIYVTLEPCTMCACAISNARLGRLYYGAADIKQGAVENGVRFYNSPSCFHKPEIYHGINAEESEKLIKNFFSNLRKK